MYRVGRKQKRVILDSLGHEVAIFHKGNEELAELTCKFLNSELKILNIPVVTATEGKYCPECGCNKLQDDLNNNYTCLNIMCDWSGRY